MFEITIGGKKIRMEDLEKELKKAAAKEIAQRLHDRLTSIRLPETGEFPTVIALAESLDEIDVRAEGSPALLALVRERMSEEDLQFVTLKEAKKAPSAFLSYAWEDRDLAHRIATALQANGIETWWAEWSIQPGDSLRQMIDRGLSQCTHFLVLLTPHSISKPWVNMEIDAGLIRKIESQARFIPVRSGLPASELTPLLKTILCPKLADFDRDITALISNIHGISRKPPLGEVPITASGPETGYSKAATRVAEVFVRESKTGRLFDPNLSRTELADKTGLVEEDLDDALHELQNFVKNERYGVHAKDELFVEFDCHFLPWTPSEDALQLATRMQNEENFPNAPASISEILGWNARRLNPAVNFLKNRQLAAVLTSLGMGEWAAFHIKKTDATRRFVRSRA